MNTLNVRVIGCVIFHVNALIHVILDKELSNVQTPSPNTATRLCHSD